MQFLYNIYLYLQQIYNQNYNFIVENYDKGRDFTESK